MVDFYCEYLSVKFLSSSYTYCSNLGHCSWPGLVHNAIYLRLSRVLRLMSLINSVSLFLTLMNKKLGFSE